jgi:uncharacterized NAD(P)/FAD-binding protein YdhS
MTAIHLLEREDGPRVHLIERRATFARGAAYSTRFKDHLLNVRASNMSAYPDRPDHFLKWLAADGGEAHAAAFASRRRYGEYLQTMLSTAACLTEPGRLILDHGDVVGLSQHGAGWRLQIERDRKLDVDAVVLAIGNFPPHLPPILEAEAAASPAFLADPWAGTVEALPETGRVVLIGSGLTMIDTVQRLYADRPALRFLAISRRGLTPHRHLDTGPSPLAWEPGPRPSIRQLTRQMRALSNSADWRSVVDGVRPHVQTIWRDWTDQERSRFLRHARPWWDIHRHRLAPEVAERIADLRSRGVLDVQAGRLRRIAVEGDGLHVTWRPRGASEESAVVADLVVNCSGPAGDLARASERLVANLVRQGLIKPDRQALGLDVDALGRVLGVNGVSERLFSIGPMTRGAFWEITSVPDIRVQAVSLADEIIRSLETLPLVA